MTRHCDAWLLPLLEGTVDSPSWAVTQSRKPHILAAISNCSLVKESLPFTAGAKCRAEQFSEVRPPVNRQTRPDSDCGQPFRPRPPAPAVDPSANACLCMAYVISATQTTAGTTQAAPASRRSLQASSSVAPVVRTSSTSSTPHPRTRRLARACNTMRDARARRS